MPNKEINQLKITMAQLTNDISYIKKSLDTNDSQHKEILAKIDHLGDTFQGKIQDKADQKETMTKFDDMDDRYASKAIEKWAYGSVGGFVVILLGIIGYLLDKQLFK